MNILAISTEWIARKLADYLTAETGVTVVFESAIVPKWKDSRISFKNVFISRRAHGGDIDSLLKERKALAQKKASNSSNLTSDSISTSSSTNQTSKWSLSNVLPFWNRETDSDSQDGSTIKKKKDRRKRNWRTAATAGQGMAWEGTHYEEDVMEEVAPPMSPDSMGNFQDLVANGYDDDADSTSQVNNNFTMFDLNVDSIDVTLSFKRWWNGMGIIEDAVIKGVRGIVGESRELADFRLLRFLIGFEPFSDPFFSSFLFFQQIGGMSSGIRPNLTIRELIDDLLDMAISISNLWSSRIS